METEPEKDCRFYFATLDRKILKPLLVYKYNADVMEKHDEVNDFMLSYANILGSIIVDGADDDFEMMYDDGAS